jgi:Flp pilus assembly protein TadG
MVSEFALVFPLFAITFLGLVDVSRAMFTYHTLTHASEAAARFASVRSATSDSPATNATVTARVLEAGVGLDPGIVDVTTVWSPSNKRGGTVRVEVTYPFEPYTPFVPWGPLELVGSAEQRISN